MKNSTNKDFTLQGILCETEGHLRRHEEVHEERSFHGHVKWTHKLIHVCDKCCFERKSIQRQSVQLSSVHGTLTVRVLPLSITHEQWLDYVYHSMANAVIALFWNNESQSTVLCFYWNHAVLQGCPVGYVSSMMPKCIMVKIDGSKNVN